MYLVMSQSGYFLYDDKNSMESGEHGYINVKIKLKNG